MQVIIRQPLTRAEGDHLAFILRRWQAWVCQHDAGCVLARDEDYRSSGAVVDSGSSTNKPNVALCHLV